MELEDVSPIGDTGYRIFVSPLRYVTPTVNSSQFQEPLSQQLSSLVHNRSIYVYE